MKVLIVDDSKFIRGRHREAVEEAGHEALESASGAEALVRFREERPDVVMVDLLMPEMDGMVLVRGLLEIDTEAKIVIISSDRQAARRAEAEALGVREFLAKPGTPAQIAGALARIEKETRDA